MTAASDNLFPKVILEEVANDGSATVTPAADHRALFLGEDGLLHAKDSAGAVTSPYSSGGGPPSILLDHALATDRTNVAITAGTPSDIIANQNFTKAAAGSVIEVIVRGNAFCNDAVSNQYLIVVVIDSAGTPVTRYCGGASNINVTANDRQNPFGAGGSFYVSGLSAAVHTVKVQILALVSNDHFYCRASTNGPTTGGEYANVQVIEHA